MIAPQGLTDRGIASADDQDLLNLYSEVMGELMERRREQHRDHWGPGQAAPTSLVAIDDAQLRRVYQLVHDEIMARQEVRPGIWEPHDDAPEMS
ncbi:hypothetical protein [Microlunatus antarcticus]|uniref:Uncharacterized protein n=1 Tax=Microlunatus antarcticus TaxID=53388 RepID=A0A7W5JU85_9ACTN|nr:hypothetical protein [Microlunatus antarcticus]MBB3326399.1 hypothetical protein [Microlunatus antarcticus]